MIKTVRWNVESRQSRRVQESAIPVHVGYLEFRRLDVDSE